MSDKEIEIQAKVSNKKALLAYLKQHAKFERSTRQVDEYFTPGDRDFLAVRPVMEWFRLRDADGRYSINYKKWHYDADGRSHYCDEFESGVEDLAALQKILKALQFRLLTVVDKQRDTWRYNDYEIAIDTVQQLGDFVEVEYKGKAAADPAAITAAMEQFLKDAGAGSVELNYVGYPFQLLFPEEQ